MSHGYGFLTESSIIPKKSKQIKINDNSGQVLLQSIIQKEKQKLKAGKKNQPISHPAKTPKRNPGIQQRIKKDQLEQQSVKLTQKNIYKCLENKSKVYEKLAGRRTNVSKLLTDFEAKDLQLNKGQEQQYQKAKADFYSGKIRELQQQQKNLHQNLQTQKSGMTDMRQRLVFQKQALRELKGEEPLDSRKPKVAQSFDNVMSKQQRQALQKVLTQQEQQKIKIESIRRRKQLMQQQRIRKLRKLNIIDDVGVAAVLQKQQEKHDQEQEQQKPNDVEDHTEKQKK